MKKMMMALPAIGIAVFVPGCFRAQEEFLAVQICVENQQGVDHLKSIMRSIAEIENLRFIDNSSNQGSDLKTMGADKALRRDPALAIDVHIEGKGGLGVTAGNLGLPPYQIALGFTEGSDKAKAHRLSGRLVRAVSQQWKVETIPRGKGALPMKSCGG